MSKNDVKRLEHEHLPRGVTTDEKASYTQALALKQGLIAVAYAISDLAEATRNPEWMKP